VYVMLIEVVETYEVEAPNEETAKEIIQKLEEKNLQSLFLKSVSASSHERRKRILGVW